jgi:hypothetical protein
MHFAVPGAPWLLLADGHRRLRTGGDVQPGVHGQLVKQRGLQRLAQPRQGCIFRWYVLRGQAQLLWQIRVETANCD